MDENEKTLFLNRSKKVIAHIKGLLNDVEKNLESTDEVMQGIGANYTIVIDECFKGFGDKLKARFDDLEKKGVVTRIPSEN